MTMGLVTLFGFAPPTMARPPSANAASGRTPSQVLVPILCVRCQSGNPSASVPMSQASVPPASGLSPARTIPPALLTATPRGEIAKASFELRCQISLPSASTRTNHQREGWPSGTVAPPSTWPPSRVSAMA